MVQRLPETYRIDAVDPRAPSQEIWDRMSPEERDRVVEMLPIVVPIELQPPEGDHHRLAKTRTTDTLDAFFRRIGRKIYVSSELAVFYPDEPRFSPDVFAVLDVDPHPRTRWTVSSEGKGLDLVIEVHYAGDTAKDYELNVERYARLGITEYFIFDRANVALRGYRLPHPEDAARSSNRGRAYRPILPQQGRYTSEVLGLDLMIESDKLRFLLGMAEIPEAEELVVKLGAMLDQVLSNRQEAEERVKAEAARAEAEAARAEAETARADAETARAEAETARADAEAARAEAETARAEAETTRADTEAARADALQQKLAEAEALIAKLQHGE